MQREMFVANTKTTPITEQYCDLSTKHYHNKCQDMGSKTACKRLEVMKLWNPNPDIRCVSELFPLVIKWRGLPTWFRKKPYNK